LLQQTDTEREAERGESHDVRTWTFIRTVTSEDLVR
jgi:hypothetical protein